MPTSRHWALAKAPRLIARLIRYPIDAIYTSRLMASSAFGRRRAKGLSSYQFLRAPTPLIEARHYSITPKLHRYANTMPHGRRHDDGRPPPPVEYYARPPPPSRRRHDGALRLAPCRLSYRACLGAEMIAAAEAPTGSGSRGRMRNIR